MRDSRAAKVGRLTKRRDFLAAASGRRFHTERMTVQGRLREDGEGLRLGLTVTRKVGHATERNRIKRRLRSALFLAAADYGSIDVDVVVIGRRDILGADHGVLVEDLRRGFSSVTKPRAADTRPSRPKSARPSEMSPLSDGERRGTCDA